MLIQFTKMHGLGNDFMVIDGLSQDIELNSEQVRQLADRRLGVGFDQLLLVLAPSQPDVDFDYRIYNADGDEVEHCGNGARCFASFVTQRGLSRKNPLTVKTVNRQLTLTIESNNEVSVDMGVPEWNPADLPFLSREPTLTYQREVILNGESQVLEFSIASMGNPHAVIIVDDVSSADVKSLGAALGQHPDFPEGVNVGFLEIVNRSHFRLRVYERGAGETLACGTGACAAMVVGCLTGHLDHAAKAELTGGELNLQWRKPDNPVLMTGPASTVFEGKIQL